MDGSTMLKGRYITLNKSHMVNSVLVMLFRAAFSTAAFTASRLTSTPKTLLKCGDADSAKSPEPQYASIKKSQLLMLAILTFPFRLLKEMEIT